MISLEGLRILFADDDVYGMKPTIDELRARGAKVTLVTDGAQLVKYLREHKTSLPDLLILDVMMGEGLGEGITTIDDGRSTGLAVYQRIRQEFNIMIPIIISTVVTHSDILQAFEGDPDLAVVRKAYLFSELHQKITRLLSRAKR